MSSDSNNVLTFSKEEKSDIINRLSDDLLKENLDEQLSSLIVKTYDSTNFLSIFDERFNYLMSKYSRDDNLKENFKEIRNELYQDICKRLEEKFSFSSNMDTDFSLNNNYYFYIRKLYEFFIINSRENLVQFFVSYINDSKESLANTFKKNTDRRNLAVTSLNKYFSDFNHVIIIFNLNEIIDSIIGSIDNGELILETIINTDEDEITNASIKDLFLSEVFDGSLLEDFPDKFFLPLKSDEYDFEIISEIKNTLLGVFNK